MDGVYDTEDRHPTPDAAIARIAAAQHGVFSRRDAAEVNATDGIVRRRLDSGRWLQVERNVFRLAGAQATWRSQLVAACLSIGPNALVSHVPAAALWRLPGLPVEPPAELIADRRNRRKASYPVHWVGPLPAADRTVVDSIPVTTISRTLLDLAGVSPSETVEAALDDALRRRLTSVARLRWQLARAGRRAGTGAMRGLLDARDTTTAPSESVLETRVARILRKARFKGWVKQHEIRVGGRLVARVDFAFPEQRVVIEADGYRYHSALRDWERDLARRNVLTNLGWRVIHFTWADLEHPERIVDQVKQALRARRV